MRRLGETLCVVLAVSGCRGSGAAPGAPSASASASVTAPPPSAPRPEPAGSGSAPAPAPATPDAGGAAPSGGNWLKCYAQFQPRTRPDLDVMRLGLMCGPSNGMRKAAESRESASSEPKEHRFQAEAGDCYRIFAVAEPSVEDLDVEVFAPNGTRVAFDTSDDRWPVVQPDRPFCVFDAGEFRAVVRAQRGQGRYNIEIWRLR
ncbi:MAG: hypothetical protein IT377_33725 [Polyangiaceae bacterium]|nr:hypothetical protein [Polyangiaceae bacterium]